MSRNAWWLVLVGAVACEEADLPGTSTGDPNLYECTYVDTALAPDDAALDTTPSAIAAALDRVFDHDATWADGTAVAATMDLQLDLGGAVLRTGGCGDHIAIPAVAIIDTDGGGFAGLTFPFDLQVSTGGGIMGWGWIDPSEVTGTWTPRALDSNETRRGISLRLEGSVDAPVATVLDETEGADADVAWAASEPILELGEGSPATTL